jgi:hypothetical protein
MLKHTLYIHPFMIMRLWVDGQTDTIMIPHFRLLGKGFFRFFEKKLKKMVILSLVDCVRGNLRANTLDKVKKV